MKTLALGVVLIIVLGIGGFLYRNVLETTGDGPVACTMEAKVCPDGSGVGREGPSCEFAPCPFPNAEDRDAQIAFVVPEGYFSTGEGIGADEEVRVVLEKPSLSESIPHNIVIRQFPLGENTAEEVLLRETVLQPSDMQVEDIEKFDRVLINGRTFYAIVVERFEAQIQSYYYLPRETDVLRFEVHERDVVDWMEPTLQIEELPEHTALLTLLTSLQSP